MDYFKLIIIITLFIISSSNSYSIPLPPKYSVSTNSATTTYKILPNSSTGNILTPQAPVSSGSTAVSTSVSANSNGYISQVNLPIGQEIAAVNVTNSVSPLALAASVAGVIPQLSTLSAVIQVGSALYSYLNANNLNPDSNGISNITNLKINTSGSSTPISIPCSSGVSPSSICSNVSSARQNAPFYATVQQVQLTSSYFKFNCTGAGGYSVGIFSCDTPSFKTQCGSNTFNSTFDQCVSPSSSIPPTQSQLLQNLIANPPSSSQFAPIISQLHTLDPTGNNDPVASLQANIDSFPPTLTQPSSTSVSPSGSHSSTTTQTSLASPDAQTLTATDTQTTTTTSPTGTVTTATTTNATPTGTNTSTTPTQTDCQMNPLMIGCSLYGSPPVAEVIPITNVPITLTPTSLGSGSCPSPISFHLIWGGNQTISWTPVCDLAIGVNPLIIAIGWLMAGYMVIGSIKA